MPTPLPSLAGSIVLKAVADLPARLFGGNAQQVEVTGLDYTLHLDISKLPTSDVTLPAADNWTVVWNASTNTYKRVEFTDLPAPTSAVPGPPGPPGGPSTVISGGGIVFSTRSVIPVSAIAAPVLSIRTDGFSTPGDGGQGLYSRMSAPPATLTNPGYVQSLDGAWWELVPEGGEVFIEQFGGKGDWNGTTGTDNLQPFYDACAVEGRTASTNFTYGPRIKFGLGRFHFSGTIDPRRMVHILGVGPILNTEFGGGTEFNFPANTLGMQINGNNTIGTSGPVDPNSLPFPGQGTGSIIEKISFYSNTPGLMGLSSTAHGIRMRTVATVRDCHFHNFAGDAVHIRGSVGASGDDYGNCNDWRVDDCVIHTSGRHGVYVEGNDVNAGSCNNLVTHGVREEWGGSGIVCISGIGMCQFSNSQITGYGNKHIWHLGCVYDLIDHTPGIGGATTPGTNNNIWYFVGLAAAVFPGVWPQWVSGGTGPFYTISRPVYNNAPGNMFTNTYVEGGGLCHFPGAVAHSINSEVSRASLAFTPKGGGAFKNMLGSTQGVGTWAQFRVGDAGYANNGDLMWVCLGGDVGNHYDSGMSFFEWHRQADEAANVGGNGAFGFNRTIGPDIYFQSPTREAGRLVFKITTPSTTEKFGRVSKTTYGGIAFDHISFNPYFDGGSGVERIISSVSGHPNRNLEHARGEYRFEVNPSAGGHSAWTCTTGGVQGNIPWVSGTDYSADIGGTYYFVDGARYYALSVDPGSALSTVKPVHTTPGQEVIGADGYGWIYIGTTAADWRRAGFTEWDKSVTYDPPSLATGAVSPIQTLAHAGVALGDYVVASFSNDLQGVILNAWCVGDNVKFQFFNPTAGVVDLGSGTVKARVQKQ